MIKHLTILRTRRLLSLLPCNTNCATLAACGACLLSADTETPSVTETTMSADLPETLKGVTKLGVKSVGNNVGGLAVLDVLGPVHHPWRDELERAGDDGEVLGKLLSLEEVIAVGVGVGPSPDGKT